MNQILKPSINKSDFIECEYCKNKVLDSNCHIYKQGKNWYCEIDNIKITQGRSGSGAATTGRFVHVHPTGQLTLGANLEVYNCATTWSASFAWVEGVLNVTSGKYHNNYAGGDGTILSSGLAKYCKMHPEIECHDFNETKNGSHFMMLMNPKLVNYFYELIKA